MKKSRNRVGAKGYDSYTGREKVIDLDMILTLFILLLFGVTVAVQVLYR